MLYTIYLLFGKIFTQNFLTKGVIGIDNYIYLSEKDKKMTSVGFSKKEIKNPCGYPQAYKQLLENFSTKKEQQKI